MAASTAVQIKNIMKKHFNREDWGFGMCYYNDKQANGARRVKWALMCLAKPEIKQLIKQALDLSLIEINQIPGITITDSGVQICEHHRGPYYAMVVVFKENP